MNRFCKYNNNPKNKLTGDCVVRAISAFLDKDWKDVYKDLVDIGIKKCVMPNNQQAYKQYLKDCKIDVQKMPKNSCGKRISVNEFLDLNPEGKFLIKVNKHLTYCKDGICYDTWNCTDYKVGNYWKI